MSDIGKIVDNRTIEEDQRITGKMSIGEIVNRYPETAGAFLQHGMYCLGCAASQYENLEQGAYAHGMDEKGVNALLDDLNGVVEKHYKNK